MAGLLFWRKKREPQVIAGDEATSYDASQESLGETTTGAEQPEAPAVVEPPAKAEKLRLFKPKVKPKAEEPVVEIVAEPEPEQEIETAVEVEPEVVAEPEPEAAALEVEEPVVADEPEVMAEPEIVAEPEPEPVVAVVVEQPESEVELEQVELPKRSFAKGIKSLFTRIKFDIENLDELEDTLIQADFGVDASAQIVEGVKQRAKKQGAKTEVELKQILEDLIAESLEREDKQLNLADGKLPYVILVVGVNGVGKTTTIGKLANWLNEGKWRVVIGAADTFRAAAVEQIATWAERANAQLIRPDAEGQDPASVAFKTVELALKNDADVAIIDTAGRLQNKKDLMAELDKIKRVVEKQAQISETLLVLDATTGQNGLVQAKAFAEVANVTGIVLTKLDGTAKGGIVYSIQRELGIPVKLVGVGEGIADFAFFDAREFAKGLVG